MGRETEIRNELLRIFASSHPEQYGESVRCLNREYDKHGAISQ